MTSNEIISTLGSRVHQMNGIVLFQLPCLVHSPYTLLVNSLHLKQVSWGHRSQN